LIRDRLSSSIFTASAPAFSLTESLMSIREKQSFSSARTRRERIRRQAVADINVTYRASHLRQPAGFEIPALRSRAESGINLFVMKPLLLLFIISAAFLYALLASDSLPFPVSLGGQPAKDGMPFAKIENPVAANAELAVESKSDMIIVNVNMVTAKNEPVQGSTPAVILLQGKTKTNIDKTMDGKKLPSGNYIMSVVSEGKTASILFTIK
jgi:hypothetical protein